MDYAPLLVIGALLLVMVFFSNRNKSKRLAEDAARRKAMVVGTRVMTTSGMYGTITAVDPDNDGGQADSITLEIAPGVQVQWALAAVRQAPDRSGLDLPPAAGAATPATDAPAAETLPEPTADGPVRLGKPKGRTGER